MNEAKIRLSVKEIELVTNAEWILTKNSILQKVNELLGIIAGEQKKTLSEFRNKLPHEIFEAAPKISKGENYKGLPYLVLDNPRRFEKENVFAIRTMFWWGNFFSITLHLAGSYKKQYEQKILSSLEKSDFFISVHASEWEHHFENSNYIALREMNGTEIQHWIKERKFLKLAQKIPLQQWDDAIDLSVVYFRQFLQLLLD